MIILAEFHNIATFLYVNRKGLIEGISKAKNPFGYSIGTQPALEALCHNVYMPEEGFGRETTVGEQRPEREKAQRNTTKSTQRDHGVSLARESSPPTQPKYQNVVTLLSEEETSESIRA